jgi:hypothetical protein
MVLSAFGIVTQDNLPFFVPVNETAPAGISPANPKGRKRKFRLWCCWHGNYGLYIGICPWKNAHMPLFQARIVMDHSESVSRRLTPRTQRGREVRSVGALESKHTKRRPLMIDHHAPTANGAAGTNVYQASG